MNFKIFFSLNSSLVYNHVFYGEKLNYNGKLTGKKKVSMKNYIGLHDNQCPWHVLRESSWVRLQLFQYDLFYYIFQLNKTAGKNVDISFCFLPMLHLTQLFYCSFSNWVIVHVCYVYIWVHIHITEYNMTDEK